MNKKLGFTLIELLVVISIIGILISILTSSFLTAQKQTRDSRRQADLEQIRQGLETYRSENGTYPADTALLSPDYINSLPTDPSGATYLYAYSLDTATTYTLCAGLEITPAIPDTCAAISCGTITCNYQTQHP
jgi:prepilin-type N-terminal cleavage/methylation domain-containing protein